MVPDSYWFGRAREKWPRVAILLKIDWQTFATWNEVDTWARFAR